MITAEKLSLGGDTRICSPGYAAKYGSYLWFLEVISVIIFNLKVVPENKFECDIDILDSRYLYCYIFIFSQTQVHPQFKLHMHEEILKLILLAD